MKPASPKGKPAAGVRLGNFPKYTGNLKGPGKVPSMKGAKKGK